jgi:hypothetical protein
MLSLKTVAKDKVIHCATTSRKRQGAQPANIRGNLINSQQLANRTANRGLSGAVFYLLKTGLVARFGTRVRGKYQTTPETAL